MKTASKSINTLLSHHLREPDDNDNTAMWLLSTLVRLIMMTTKKQLIQQHWQQPTSVQHDKRKKMKQQQMTFVRFLYITQKFDFCVDFGCFHQRGFEGTYPEPSYCYIDRNRVVQMSLSSLTYGCHNFSDGVQHVVLRKNYEFITT